MQALPPASLVCCAAHLAHAVSPRRTASGSSRRGARYGSLWSFRKVTEALLVQPTNTISVGAGGYQVPPWLQQLKLTDQLPATLARLIPIERIDGGASFVRKLGPNEADKKHYTPPAQDNEEH
jgi:hypothetical protein